jgi:hypothetical protein
MDSLVPGGLEKLQTQREKVDFCHTIKPANVRYIVSVAKTSKHIAIACFLQRQGIVLQRDTRGIRTELSYNVNDTRQNRDFYYPHCRPFYRSPNPSVNLKRAPLIRRHILISY